MTEEEWLAHNSPRELVQWVYDRGRASGRKLRLFASACSRRIAPHFIDGRSAALIEVSDRFADAQATQDELERAFAAATEAEEAIRGASEDAVEQASAEAVLGLGVELQVGQVAGGVVLVVDRLAQAAVLGQFRASGRSLSEATEEELFIPDEMWGVEEAAQTALVRDIFGNPFRPVAFDPAWRTDTAVAVARQMYESRDFGAMPILADALQDSGCEDEHILAHCRDTSAPHVRGCWVCDLVLAKV